MGKTNQKTNKQTTSGSKEEKARFDTRLPKSQKEFFEYAASIGGFRTLTDFVLFAAQEKANAIVKRHERVLASERDQEIFFHALMNPEAPNEALQTATDLYLDKLNQQ